MRVDVMSQGLAPEQRSSVVHQIIMITAEMKTAFGVLLLLIATQLWGASIFHGNLSIDDELSAFRGSGLVWIREGRLVSYWLEKIIGQTSVFLLPYMMLIGAQVLSFLIFLFLFDVRDRGWKMVMGFVAFASFPTTWELMQFNTNVPGYAIGLVIVSSALLLHKKIVVNPSSRIESIRLALVSVILVTTAVLIYQSLITIYLAGAVGMLLCQAIFDGPARLRRAALLTLLVTGVSLVAYGVISTLTLALLAETLSAGFQAYRFAGSSTELVKSVLHEMISVYSGRPSVYGLSIQSLPVLIGVTAAGLVLAGFKIAIGDEMVRPARIAARSMIILAALLCSPLLFTVKTGPLPLRTYVGLPFVILILILILDRLASRNGRLRLASSLVIAMIAFQCILAVSEYYAAAGYAQHRDQVIATDMIQRIRSNPDFDPAKKYTLLTHGMISNLRSGSPYRITRDGIATASFFDWDNGNPKRVSSYLRLHGLDLARSPLRQPASAEQQLHTMRPWPEAESIRIVNDMILIRLGV